MSLVLTAGLLFPSLGSTQEPAPFLDGKASLDTRVDDLLGRLTPEQKQANRAINS